MTQTLEAFAADLETKTYGQLVELSFENFEAGVEARDHLHIAPHDAEIRAEYDRLREEQQAIEAELARRDG